MQMTSTRLPSGVSPSLSPSSYTSSSSVRTVSSPPSLASWTSPCQCDIMRGGGLSSASFPCFPHPPLSPRPRPPLFPLMPHPLASWIFRSSCWLARVWPLCGSPLGRKLMIRATMDQACSSGAPLPPNGGGAPSPTLGPPWASPRISSPSIRLEVGGGLLSSWGSSRISCIRLRTKGVHACSGGGPLSPSG